METLSTVKNRYKLASEHQRGKFDKFNSFDYVYHSVLKYSDPNVASKVFNPIVWSFIETIVTRMLAKNPVVAYKPRERNDEAQSKILSQLFSYWYTKSDAYPKMVAWVKDALIYGTGIVKMDWYTSPPRMVKSYVLDETGTPALDETGSFQTQESPVIDFDDPRIQNVNIYDFFIDPKATSIEDAKWVIHQYWVDIEDLKAENEAAKQFGKVIYNKSALRRLEGGKVTESEYEENRKQAAGLDSNFDDKTVSRVKIWEMREDNRIVVIGNESEVLRDETNPYWNGKKGFVRIVDSIVPHEFWGKGEIEPVEKMVHALNTVQNQRITNVNRVLNPMWKAKEGVADDELQFIDNGIIHVDDVDDANLIQIPDITSKAHQEQEALIEQIQRALGVTDYVQGVQTPGQTAKEVDIKTAQANARFAHKVRLFEEMGLTKVGEYVYEYYQQFTTKDKVIRITGTDGEAYLSVTPAQLVGEYDVIPQSASTLETDQEAEFQKAVNLFGMLQPYFKNSTVDPMTGQPIESGLVDQVELIKELITKSGVKNPERFLSGQNQPLPNSVPGQVPQNAGIGQGNPVQQPPRVEGLSTVNNSAGLDSLLSRY